MGATRGKKAMGVEQCGPACQLALAASHIAIAMPRTTMAQAFGGFAGHRFS